MCYDKHGKEITSNMTIKHDDGDIYKVIDDEDGLAYIDPEDMFNSGSVSSLGEWSKGWIDCHLSEWEII